MPAENKAAAVVPLISSSIAGPLGVKHLPRLWNKVLLSAKGLLHEDYPPFGGFDEMVLSAIGLSQEETETYVKDNVPTYPEFEQWVLQKSGGSLNQEAIERVNAAIMNTTYNEYDRKVVFAVSGLEDDASIADAVTLSNLADWEEFHRNLVSGYEESTQETIITGGCHCGAVRYRVTNVPTHGGSGVCHCYSCRLVGGAPYLPWVFFPKESFAWIRGEPKYYYYIRGWADTAIGWTQRGFCEKCGTQLTFMNNDGPPEEREKYVFVNACSLDNPNAFPPTDWTGGINYKLSWVHLPVEATAELITKLNKKYWEPFYPDILAALKQIGTPEAMKAVEAYEKNIPVAATAELITKLRSKVWEHAHPDVIKALKQIGTPKAMKAVEEYERRKQVEDSRLAGAERQGEN